MSAAALPSGRGLPPPPDPLRELGLALGAEGQVGIRPKPLLDALEGMGMIIISTEGRTLGTLEHEVGSGPQAMLMRWCIRDPTRRPLVAIQYPRPTKNFQILWDMQLVDPYNGTVCGTLTRRWREGSSLLRDGRTPLTASGPGMTLSPFAILQGPTPLAQVRYPHRFGGGWTPRATTGMDVELAPTILDAGDRGAVFALAAFICFGQGMPKPAPF